MTAEARKTPFTIRATEEQLADLRERLRRTRLPQSSLWPGWVGGTDPDYVRSLLDYWIGTFDWRLQESALNGFHHFTTGIEGQVIHFIHEKAERPGALPIVLAHGWPGTFVEMTRLIPRLTHPTRFGGDAEDAFDVVVPSLPGFAYSSPPKTRREYYDTHRLWDRLMTEVLGCTQYAAHGGDLGTGIATSLASFHEDHVVGLHLTSVGNPVALDPSVRSLPEQKYFEAEEEWEREEGGYEHLQMTRPVTIGHALTDSPAGLAAYIVEKFRAWSDCGGDVETRFDKDLLLTNVMIYWLTGTIVTSFLPYYAYAHDRPTRSKRVEVPTAFALFPADLSQPPRELADRGYNVERWTPMPRGGHFAALEEPDLLSNDLRAFLRPLRE
jgi:pimeloyl-ACP methyl ester carboxylesterase